jgi:DNA-binding response OmpR family regulator
MRTEERMPEIMSAHILVVDDDPQIRSLLNEYLTENGMRVSSATSGREMMQILDDETIDLVILDLRLKDEDGMSLARGLRERLAISVIMLTGVREEADRVMGLELGADDYVTKPFSPRELLARIRTVLRRAKSAPPDAPSDISSRRDIRAYRFGGFELNLRTRRLKRQDGRAVNLTNGELNLLAALLAAPERILTRDQLLEASRVYDNEVYDRAIDIQVLRLRRKIEEDPANPRFIVTERGVGYVFSAPVEVLY